MLCNWCHKKIPQGEEYREKSKGYGSWSTYRGTGGGSYNYKGGGYYHFECYKKYQEWKSRQQWIDLLIKIWFGVAIIISVGVGYLFESVLVGFLLIVLLFFLPLLVIYFRGKQKMSRMQEKTTQFKNKILTCRNCKQEYFDFYSQRKLPNEDYVFKWEEGYCMTCTHELFYPKTISKCKVCKETIYVKDNKVEGSDICQDCYKEKENQEKVRERIKKRKVKQGLNRQH